MRAINAAKVRDGMLGNKSIQLVQPPTDSSNADDASRCHNQTVRITACLFMR